MAKTYSPPVFRIAEALMPLAVPVTALHPDPENARKHPDTNIEHICDSLDKFGQMSPIVVNSDGKILKGNGTYLAALKLGATQIAAVSIDHLNPEEQDVYALSDNQTGLTSLWDEAKVNEIVARTREIVPDSTFPGWDEKEVQQMIAAHEKSLNADASAGEHLPDPDYELKVPKRVMQGDVWSLGPHRLRCGRSDEYVVTNAFMTGSLFLPDDSVALIATDPPYGAQAVGSRTQTKKDKGLKAIKNDDLTGPALTKLLVDSLRLVPLANAATLCMFYNWKGTREFWAAADELKQLGQATGDADAHYANLTIQDIIIWNKNQMGLCAPESPRPRPKYEMMMWASVAEGKFPWYGGRDVPDVWDVNRPTDRPGNHPTPKPVELYRRCVEYFTQPGDIVYDPFGGSGPLLVVCEAKDRIARICEIEESYCDWMVAYYEDRTGTKAVLEYRTETVE